MPPPLLTRRSFLAATGGLMVAAACGSSGSGDDGAVAQGEGLSALLLATDLYASDAPQRFVFGLAEGREYTSGPPATIAFALNQGQLGESLPTALHSVGLPSGRGVYTVDASFPEPGVWLGLVSVEGEEAEIAFQVQEQPTALVPGAAAPRAPSPTVADPMGVEPLCTRDPDCSLHDRSLDELLGTGKPVAVLFATPARCSSQYCGPVLDELLTLVDDYRERIDFVHVEIYMADTGVETVPTVQAWNLATEPWLYGVDPSGTIASRLDGAFGRDEVRALLDTLAA